MDNLNDKHILITGGTGSFGKAFTRKVLECFPHIRRLVIFSRDELKQYEMAQHFSTTDILGSVISSVMCAIQIECAGQWKV